MQRVKRIIFKNPKKENSNNTKECLRLKPGRTKNKLDTLRPTGWKNERVAVAEREQHHFPSPAAARDGSPRGPSARGVGFGRGAS